MKRCERCGFLSDEKIPVGDDGLCLWCRLTVEGCDWAEFYESGDWMEAIDWRGDVLPGDQVREMIRRHRREAGHTWADVEEMIGSRGRHSIQYFMRCTQVTWLSVSTVEAIARYLGCSVEEISDVLGDLVFKGQNTGTRIDDGTHIDLDWPEAQRFTRRLRQRRTRLNDTLTDLKREYGISPGVWYRFVQEKCKGGPQTYVWARTLRRFADYLDISFERAVEMVQR